MKKEELLKLSFYFVAATTASMIRYIRQEKKSFPVFMLEMLLGASFAFFIVPAIVEHWQLSLYMGTGIFYSNDRPLMDNVHAFGKGITNRLSKL